MRWACALLGLLLPACAPGAVAGAARGEPPQAAAALGGGACAAPADDAEPWVVDLPADQRVALDAALSRGLAVVAYDCHRIELLRGCEADGDYAFTATTVVEDRLVLEDADAVAMKLSGGAALAASLEAEIARGSRLHIGVVLVGQRATTRARPARDELRGDCGRATHVVARAAVGAYAVAAGASAELGTVAAIFAQGAAARSVSRSFRATAVGRPEACAGAALDDAAPPASCGAPVKLELLAVAPPSGAAAAPSPGAAAPPRRAGGAARPEGPSAADLGFMYEHGKGVPADELAALREYQRACGEGDADGCAGLGMLTSKGRGDPADQARAEALLQDACARGSARACSGLGHRARLAGDGGGALRLLDRACRLGYARACFYAGALLAAEEAEKADLPRALRSHRRACQGGDPRGCLALAGMLSAGRGAPPDPEEANRQRSRALNALRRACDAGDHEDCQVLGDFYLGRYGERAPEPGKALAFLERACAGGRRAACFEACRLGHAESCARAASHRDRR